MKIQQGTTRCVFLIYRWAFKIPRLWDWYNGLSGLLANRHESLFSPICPDRLCPVHWSAWGGWLVIMPRADVTQGSIDQWREAIRNHPDRLMLENIVELKPSSIGMLNGRLVAVDYGS